MSKALKILQAVLTKKAPLRKLEGTEFRDNHIILYVLPLFEHPFNDSLLNKSLAYRILHCSEIKPLRSTYPCCLVKCKQPVFRLEHLLWKWDNACQETRKVRTRAKEHGSHVLMTPSHKPTSADLAWSASLHWQPLSEAWHVCCRIFKDGGNTQRCTVGPLLCFCTLNGHIHPARKLVIELVMQLTHAPSKCKERQPAVFSESGISLHHSV